MTDRELLELAAKAIGIKPASYEGIKVGWYDPARGSIGAWNPFTNDGDALRLAVRLKMNVCVFDDYVCVSCAGLIEFDEDAGCDIQSATCRAIVRCAAEMGRAM